MVLEKAPTQIVVPWFVHSNRYQWILAIRHVVLLLHHTIIVVHSGRICPAVPSFPNHVLDEGFIEIVLVHDMAGTPQLHGKQGGLQIAGHGSAQASKYGDKVHVFGNGVVGLALNGIEFSGDNPEMARSVPIGQYSIALRSHVLDRKHSPPLPWGPYLVSEHT